MPYIYIVKVAKITYDNYPDTIKYQYGMAQNIEEIHQVMNCHRSKHAKIINSKSIDFSCDNKAINSLFLYLLKSFDCYSNDENNINDDDDRQDNITDDCYYVNPYYNTITTNKEKDDAFALLIDALYCTIYKNRYYESTYESSVRSKLWKLDSIPANIVGKCFNGLYRNVRMYCIINTRFYVPVIEDSWNTSIIKIIKLSGYDR